METVGTTGIQRSCPLERQFRDLLTMAQHVMGQTTMWERAGGLWFDQAPPIPLL